VYHNCPGLCHRLGGALSQTQWGFVTDSVGLCHRLGSTFQVSCWHLVAASLRSLSSVKAVWLGCTQCLILPVVRLILHILLLAFAHVQLVLLEVRVSISMLCLWNKLDGHNTVKPRWTCTGSPQVLVKCLTSGTDIWATHHVKRHHQATLNNLQYQ